MTTALARHCPVTDGGTTAERRQTLMLVSADVSQALRDEVSAHVRPRPDFLALEEQRDVRLLDWSSVSDRSHRRTPMLSLKHVAAALPELRGGASAVLSDGEHVGIPLAGAMSALRTRVPHVMIGHRMLTRTKRRAFRLLPGGVDRIIVHSKRQADLLPAGLAVPPSVVRLIPYGIDTDFWSTSNAEGDDDLVFAAGREHRDYRTLADACSEDPVRVVITDHSSHSPGARRQALDTWPANVERRSLSFPALREMYARATVVVVPLMATDFPAGITGALEAMAMGKPVIVSGTPDLAEVVEDGRTGVVVRPGDTAALRAAIRRLLGDPVERRHLGEQARLTALRRHSLEVYAASLADQLSAVAGTRAT